MTITSEQSGRALRVLVVHNAYQQRGGEDSVVEAEVALLRAAGHQVDLMRQSNDDINGMSRARLAARTLWSVDAIRQLREAVSRQRHDVVHVHNTLPLVSPSIYWGAASLSVPVVQTLHNFRFLCPQATFLREGRVCEDCLGGMPWAALRHRCYRESLPQTAAIVGMLGLHRVLGTYQHKVTRYIALNQFCRDKFVAGGLPADRIQVKPNFVEDPGAPDFSSVRAGALYVGRLSIEKGVEVLVDAARLHPDADWQVIGDGPLQEPVRATLGRSWLGAQPAPAVMQAMRQAAFLVLPSTCYEGFPRTLVEAYASALPVIASRHGSLAELVHDGETGLLFTPGDAADLVAKVRWAQQHPERMRQMGMAARALYEREFTPARNLTMLQEIYASALADRNGLAGDAHAPVRH